MTIDKDGNACLDFDGRAYFKDLKLAQNFQELLFKIEDADVTLKRECSGYWVDYSVDICITINKLRE